RRKTHWPRSTVAVYLACAQRPWFVCSVSRRPPSRFAFEFAPPSSPALVGRTVRGVGVAVLGLWASLGVSRSAEATPRRTARIDGAASRSNPPIPAGGLSVGSPTDGHLAGGAHLEESPWLRGTPCYAGEDVRWGLESLVSLIDHGARSVRKLLPDSVLSIGHLSRKGGGDLDRHASHESGRDADVGFYIHSQTGKPPYPPHFVAFRGDGTAPSWPGAFFDDARNWALVSSVATDPSVRVTYIFDA